MEPTNGTMEPDPMVNPLLPSPQSLHLIVQFHQVVTRILDLLFCWWMYFGVQGWAVGGRMMATVEDDVGGGIFGFGGSGVRGEKEVGCVIFANQAGRFRVGRRVGG